MPSEDENKNVPPAGASAMEKLAWLLDRSKHGAAHLKLFGSGSVVVSYASHFRADIHAPHDSVGDGYMTDKDAQWGRHGLAKILEVFDPPILAKLVGLAAAIEIEINDREGVAHPAVEEAFEALKKAVEEKSWPRLATAEESS
jgi:hypothetical protein